MARTSAMNSASREPRSRSIASLTVRLVLRGPGVKRRLGVMDIAEARTRLSRDVAQICNLLYRRLAACERTESSERMRKIGRPADCKSAIQQIANLRYIGVVQV